MMSTGTLMIYPYCGVNSDAVGKAVVQLGFRLGQSGQDCKIYSLPDWASKISAKNRFGRAIVQLWFLVAVLLHMITHRNHYKNVVTVDVPSGVGLVITALKSTGLKGRHIAWVMDLYRLRNENRPSLLSKTRSRAETYSLRSADTVVTLGTCMHDTLLSELGVTSQVIPIWQDETEFPSEQIKELTNPRTNKPVRFVYSGTARHGFHPLAAILGVFSETAESINVVLVLRGNGSEIDAARQMANSPYLSIDRPVPQHMLAATLATDDVAVASLALDKTGTCVPSKVYAAMASARPILYMGDAKGQAALDISAAGCGLVVSPDEPQEIRKAVLALASSRTLRSQMGNAGRRFFESQRSLEVCEQIWRELLNESARISK